MLDVAAGGGAGAYWGSHVMAWGRLEDTFWNDRKFKKLARLLGIPRAHAHGLGACLWSWCLVNAPDGNLDGWDADDIADGARWEEDPAPLISAMTEVGLLDRIGNSYTVHGYYDRNESYQRAQKKRAYREKVSRSVQGQSEDGPDQPGRTVQTSQDGLSRREEKRREETEEKIRDEMSAITSTNQIEPLGSALGYRPITGRDLPKISKLLPITRSEFDQAAKATRDGAAKPGWGYWASCLESIRHKPEPPERDVRHGPARPSTVFTPGAKLSLDDC